MNLAFVQVCAALAEPALGSSVIVGMACSGCFGQVFTSMVPIHDAYAIWEEVGGEIPDPFCAICGYTGIQGLRNLVVNGDFPKGFAGWIIFCTNTPFR